MRVIAGEGRRGPITASVIVGASVAGLAFTVATGSSSRGTIAAFSAFVCVVLLSKPLTRWTTMLNLLVLTIVFVPIRRYTLGGVGFQLEPYRLLIGLLIFAWGSSLLIDQRVRLRASGMKGPLMALLAAIVFSELPNISTPRVQAVQSEMVKSMTFFLSFLALVVIIVSLVRTDEQRDRLLKLLVGGATIVAISAIYESRTNYNVFDHLHSFLPLLKPFYFGDNPLREGRVRAYGSAEHPIALGALFAMVLPFTFYLARRTGQRRWGVAALLLCAGAFSTVSRTAMIMLVVTVITYAILRFRDVKRFWPALIPLVAVVHIAMPGVIGTISQSFHPKGGLVAEQSSSVGSRAAAGRLADLGPAMQTFQEDPLLGLGFGTSITVGPKANAPILDDQWLGSMIETGVFGVLAWLWIFVRFIRRTGREAKRSDSDRSWLMAAFCAAITSFAVGMITYDAFSFIQETLVMFILLALGCSALVDKTASAGQADSDAAALVPATASAN
jgi:hypothetical protein